MGAMVSPQIPLETQTPRPADPLEAYGRVMALRQALGQQQLQQQQIQGSQLENQQKQTQLDQMHALNNAYSTSFNPTTGGFDSDKLLAAVTKSGHAELAPKIVEGQLALEKSFGEAGKLRLETANLQSDAAGSFGKQLQTANYDPQIFLHGAQLAINKKTVDPQTLTAPIQAVQKSLLADPTGEQAKQIVKQFSDQAIGSSEKWTALQSQQKTAEAASQRGQAAATEADLKKFQQLGSQLGASTDKDSYARAYYSADPAIAAKYPQPDQFNPQSTPQQARQIGMTPEQQQSTGETARHNQAEEGQGRQRIGIENQRLGVEQAKLGVERFNAGIGADGKPLQDSDKTLLNPVVQHTSDGRTFLDESTAFKNLPKGQQLQLRQAAVNAGVPMVSAQDASKIQKLDTVKQNLDSVFDIYSKNAASNAGTRSTGVPYLENKLGTVLQTNPELRGAESNKLGSLETLKDAMGRVNTVEINKADAMMPQLGDTKATVEQKRQEFHKFLDQHLSSATHSTKVAAPNPATADPLGIR